MKKLLLMTIAFWAIYTTPSIATEMKSVEGTIKAMRTSSQYNESYGVGSDIDVIFRINGSHSECSWLGITSTDTGYLSFLLSAQVHSTTITAWYYPSKKSSTWNNVCQATTIEVK